jgi:hypothetical protein
MSGDVADFTLPGEAAWELGEMLEFLYDWIAYDHDRGHDTLSRSLDRFTGYGYTIDELRADLARFSFLLGGDGQRLIFGAER